MARTPDKPTHDVYALYRDEDGEELINIGTITQHEDGTGSFRFKCVPTNGWRNRGVFVPAGAPPPDIPKRPPNKPAAPPPRDTFAALTGEAEGDKSRE